MTDAVRRLHTRLQQEAAAGSARDTATATLLGAGLGVAGALAAWLAGVPPWWRVVAAVAPVAAAWVIGARAAGARWTLARAADTLERTYPADNLVITAEALARDDGARFLPEVAAAANARLEDVPLPSPAGARWRLATALAVTAAAATAAVVATAPRAPAANATPAGAVAAQGEAPVIRALTATITAPRYLGGAVTEARDPNVVEVPGGGHVALAVEASAPRLDVSRDGAPIPSPALVDGKTQIALPQTPDGVWVLTPRTSAGEAGQARLVTVRTVPDAPPTVRVLDPARDRRYARPVPDLPVQVEARDDHAVTSLLLRFTKVSGSGESLTFADHDVPVTTTRDADGQWHGAARLPLASLDLEDGDLVVYRGVATDGRPGGAAVESDAFVVEVGATRAASSTAGGGEDVDPEDRQAISQQMVLVKTERLRAAEAAMPPAELLAAAQALAIEQRMVRAEFVFLMGGEVEDEVEEAAHAHDLVEGRAENTGQAALLGATRAMSRAEARLTAGDTVGAIVAEREALKFLQQAFDRRRFLLRPVAERARIDPARRLQGTQPTTAPPRLDVREPQGPTGLGTVARAATAVARARTDEAMDLVPVAAAIAALPGADADRDRVTAALVAAADLPARRATLLEAQRAVHAAAARLLAPALPAEPAASVSGAVAETLRRRGGR